MSFPSKARYRPPTKAASPRRKDRPLRIAPDAIAPSAEADRVWEHAVEQLRKLPGIDEAAIINWIEPYEVLGELRELDDLAICVAASRTVADWGRRRYLAALCQLVRDEGTFAGVRIFDRAAGDSDGRLL